VATSGKGHCSGSICSTISIQSGSSDTASIEETYHTSACRMCGVILSSASNRLRHERKSHPSVVAATTTAKLTHPSPHNALEHESTLRLKGKDTPTERRRALATRISLACVVADTSMLRSTLSVVKGGARVRQVESRQLQLKSQEPRESPQCSHPARMEECLEDAVESTPDSTRLHMNERNSPSIHFSLVAVERSRFHLERVAAVHVTRVAFSTVQPAAPVHLRESLEYF
jgi:hypothetical protein